MIKDLEMAIGYRFNNISLLQNALTHSSYMVHDPPQENLKRGGGRKPASC